MPKPPIRELILENRAETLKTIRVANGYSCDIMRVTRFQVGQPKEFPSASVYDVAESMLQGPMEVESRRMSIVVEGWVKAEERNLSTNLNYFMADIIRAFTLDYSCGRLAINCALMDATMQLAEVGVPLGIVQVQFDIDYRYIRTHPDGPGCT